MSARLSMFREGLIAFLVVSCSALTISPLSAATILFFVNNARSPERADSFIVQELKDQGHQVMLFATATSNLRQQLRTAESAAVDMLLISETIGSDSILVGSNFLLKDLAKPIVSFEAYMWDNADWTGRERFVDCGNTGRPGDLVDHPELHECQKPLYIALDQHCLAAGFSGEVEVYTEPYSLNFGFPSDDAKVIATVDEGEEFPTFFVYEAGDVLMDGSEAPAVRIGLFLGQSADPNCNVGLNWDIVTDEGQDLLFNAIGFALDSIEGDPECPGAPAGGPRFKRGDPTGDDAINVTDVVFVLNFLFVGTAGPDCNDAADADDSGDVNLADAVQILNFLFAAGQAPAAPFEECGEDPTEDDNVECVYPPCE